MDKKREAFILQSSEKKKQGKKKESSIVALESNQELFHMPVHTISTHQETLHISVDNTCE